eukprot:jgi/Bigna1/76026/fgenesh1_pg.38_\
MTVFFTNEPTRNHPRHARTMAGPEGGHEKKGRETSEKDLYIYWDIEGCRVSLHPQDGTKTVEAITKSMKNAFQKDHGGREPKNIRITAYVQTSWASKFQNQAMLQEIQQAGVQLVLVANPHNKPQVADIQIMRDIFQYLQSRRGGEAAVGLIAADGDFAGHLAVLKSSKVSTYVITSAKGGSRSCLHQFNVIGEWPLDTAKDVFECQQPPMKQNSPVRRRKNNGNSPDNADPSLTVKNNSKIEGKIAKTGPMHGFIRALVWIFSFFSSAIFKIFGTSSKQPLLSPVSPLPSPCSSGGISPERMGGRVSPRQHRRPGRKARAHTASPRTRQGRRPGRKARAHTPNRIPSPKMTASPGPRQGRRPGRKARAHTASRTPSPKMTTKQNAPPTRVPAKVKMVEGPFAIAEIHGGKIVHFSADHCTHQNPQIGDVVLVSYHNGDGKTADDDLIIASNVQKIITSYGNIRQIGPSCGLIKIPSVKRDVFFRREALHEYPQPVNGASVLVSYVCHRNGNLEAMHVRKK